MDTPKLVDRSKRRFIFTFETELPAEGRTGDPHPGAEPPEQKLANELIYTVRAHELGVRVCPLNEPTGEAIKRINVKYGEIR